MAFDFGAGLTAVGNMQPAYQAQRQQEVEQRRAQIEAEQKQRYNDLLQKTNQQKLDTEKKQWIKIGEPYVDATGAQKQRYQTPEGFKEDTIVASYPTVAEQLSRSGWTEKTANPEVMEAFRLISSGMSPAQAVSMSRPKIALKPYKMPDGSIQYFDAANPESIPPGATAYEAGVDKAKTPDQRFLDIRERKAMGTPLSPDDTAFEKAYADLIKTKTTDPKVAGYSALAQSRIVTPVDPNDPTREVYTSAGDAARRGLTAPGSIDYRMQMPTASERQRGDFALSAHEQLGDMKKILASRANLFGPISGRFNDFNQWIGSTDPDAQRFRSAATTLSDHAMVVFGGRSQYASEAIYNMAGRNATNPQAIAAGLDQLDKALKTVGSRRVGAIPTGSGAAALGAAQGSGKTYKQTATGPGGHKIGSDDGGNTWFDLSTGKKVQ